VTDLSVHYGGVSALRGVNLDIKAGHLVGLIGPNGAGKTTLLDALSGFAPYRGQVRFGGRNLDGLPPHRRQRAGMARTFQSVELYDDLTVLENLMISVSPSVKGLLPELLWGHRARASARVEDLLDRFGLREHASKQATDLSQGERKLVAVARALASEAPLVLLDEPAAGLDSEESQWLGTKLKEICATGTTLVLVDHDMSLVLGVCDQVYVLNFGELIACGTPNEVRADEAVVAAYLGGTAVPQEDLGA
jgi:ABC-type branched-subunit amino acid transport system ATPase component